MSGVNSKFESGDIIAVFGGSISKEEKLADNISICTVLVCGQEDLIVRENKPAVYSSGDSVFKVSKGLCLKLHLDPNLLEEKSLLSPKIGDLVISYEKETFTRKEAIKKTGILYKIIYKYGKPYKGSLICGSKMVEVYYEDLMVLQSTLEDKK